MLAGGALKSTSPLWLTPNTGATDSSGFMALPGGNRNYDGSSGNFGYEAIFWSSTTLSLGSAWCLELSHSNANASLGYYNDFENGYSCRCVKDSSTTTGISKMNNNGSIMAYPNPSKDLFSIQIYSYDDVYSNISVFNMLGNEVYHRETALIRGINSNVLDLQNLAPGIYILRLKNVNGEWDSKLVKN